MRLPRATAALLLAGWAAAAAASSITTSPPPHLPDQVANYEAFVYRPMPFALTDLEGQTTTEVLTPP
jgi:hypothetical protein